MSEFVITFRKFKFVKIQKWIFYACVGVSSEQAGSILYVQYLYCKINWTRRSYLSKRIQIESKDSVSFFLQEE